KCNSCPKFTLHRACAELPDKYEGHPFYVNPFTFRKKTRLPHDCSACGEPLEGFLFSSPTDGVRLHPLCINLPRTLTYGGHRDHPLQLLMTGGKFNCSRCNEDKHFWSYRCEEIVCKLRVDLNCVKVDLHGISEHGFLRAAPGSRRKECMGALGNATVFTFRTSGKLALRFVRCFCLL
ncbi:hypothetical protein KI387_041562, partial [Taxus chinensis]